MIVGTRCSRPKYEFERTCWAPGKKGWTERSGGGAVAQACRPTGSGVGHTAESGGENPRGLDAPERRGKRQITDEVALVEAIDKVLKRIE